MRTACNDQHLGQIQFDCNQTPNEYTDAISHSCTKYKSTLGLEVSLDSEFPPVTEFRSRGLTRLWIRAFSRHQENRWKKLTFLTEISFFALNKSQTNTHTQNDIFFVFQITEWFLNVLKHRSM